MKGKRRIACLLLIVVLIISGSVSAYANVAQKKAISTSTRTIRMVTGERLRTYFQSRAGKKATYTIKNKKVLGLTGNGKYMFAQEKGNHLSLSNREEKPPDLP